MATDDATIMGSESTLYVEWDIAEICGIQIGDFIEENQFLTRELVERHFEAIVKYVNQNEESYIAFQVLGYIILKTGSTLPEPLRAKILKCASYQREQHFWSQNPSWEKPRMFFLEDFKTKIKNHRSGQITYLATTYPDDPDYVLKV